MRKAFSFPLADSGKGNECGTLHMEKKISRRHGAAGLRFF